jgi:hypothetical protein
MGPVTCFDVRLETVRATGPAEEFLRACSLGARAETAARVAW